MNRKPVDWFNRRIAEEFTRMFANAAHRQERALKNEGAGERGSKNGSFPFIPMGTQSVAKDFVLTADLIRQKSRKYCEQPTHWMYNKTSYQLTFLDAGCGIGNIMLIANMFGLGGEQHGIEYDKKTIDAAHKFLRTYSDRNNFVIHHGDILTFPNYKDYDIIYYYCPFSSYLLQAFFEERLEDEVKVGTIIMPYLKRSDVVRKDSRFKRLTTRRNYPKVLLKVRDGERKHSVLPAMMKDPDRWTNLKMPKHYKKMVTQRLKDMEERGCFS